MRAGREVPAHVKVGCVWLVAVSCVAVPPLFGARRALCCRTHTTHPDRVSSTAHIQGVLQLLPVSFCDLQVAHCLGLACQERACNTWNLGLVCVLVHGPVREQATTGVGPAALAMFMGVVSYK
jgi:hypothetical protein